MKEIVFHPIGVVHSPIGRHSEAPIQPQYSKFEGEIEIFPEFADGLKDLDGFSHITVVFNFHLSENYELLTYPYMDSEKRGVFATRSPWRPNAIGISTLRLLSVDGGRLKVRGLDILDGAPVLDIKPHIPGFAESDSEIRTGWLKNRPATTDGRKSSRDRKDNR